MRPQTARGRSLQAFSLTLERQAEDVAHVVEAGLAAGHPERRTHGADGEGVAGARPVRDLDAVAVTEKENRVVADHVAAADRLHADLARAARPDVAVARVAGGGGQVAA